MMEKLSSLIGPERERIQNHNWDCAIFSYGAEANPCSHFEATRAICAQRRSRRSSKAVALRMGREKMDRAARIFAAIDSRLNPEPEV